MKNYISGSQCNITVLSSELQNSKNISLPTVNKNLKQNVICKNMSYLTLTDRKITEFPKDLNELASPQVLFVERSYLEELPGALGTLIRLAKINASYNQIVDLPRSLGNLNKLTCIDISHNCLQYMPTALNCLECLAILDISYNSISTIDTQPHWLHTITILQLQHNKLQYLPHWINQASRLYDLNVSYNPLESQSVIISAETTESKIRTVKHCGIFRRLHCLDLRNCGIEKHLPLQLINLPDLTELRLGNDIPLVREQNVYKYNYLMELPNEVHSVLGPSLQVLDLCHLQLCGLPEELSSLSCLRVLLLRGNPLIWLPSTFKCLKNLEMLDLSQCDLIELHGCIASTKLVHLNLSNNKLVKLPDNMRDMFCLEHLDLFDNQFEELPEIVLALPSLKALDFSWNYFSPQEKMNDADFKKYQMLKDNLRQCHDKKNRSDCCKKHMKNVESNSSLDSLVDPEVETYELTGDNGDVWETSSLPSNDLLPTKGQFQASFQYNHCRREILNAFVGEMENWDGSSGDENDENFDPNVNQGMDVRLINEKEARYVSETYNQRIRYGELFFCPGENHAPKIVRTGIRTLPETGQFEDAEATQLDLQCKALKIY